MNAFRCPKCGAVTDGDEDFCVNCGQPLKIICPECGNAWRYMFNYKFCPECGHDMKDVNAKLKAGFDTKP